MNSEIVSEAAAQMAILPYNLHVRVLTFKNYLCKKNGVSGKNLLKYAGFIPLDDLRIMSDVIENDCRKIDINEW